MAGKYLSAFCPPRQRYQSSLILLLKKIEATARMMRLMGFTSNCTL